MGLQADVKNVTFDSIIPGLAANKYDLGMSSFTVTKEREKTVDFVTYAIAGTSFYVKADGGPDIQSLADLCGQKVAAERGTTQADGRDRAGQEVHGGRQAGRHRPGLPGPERRQPRPVERSRRRRAWRTRRPPPTRSSSRTASSSSPASSTATALYGIAMPKDSGLAKPVQGALKAVMADGTYDRIFDYWGLVKKGTAGCPCTITNPEINPTNVPAS